MTSRSNRDTVVIVANEARLLGATVIAIKRSSRHPGITLRTSEGVQFTMRVHPGKIEPYKQKGWVRQAINRANKHKANDNGPR